MMRRPRLILFIGFVLVLSGAVIPFLMVMGILKSTFFLNFFAYTASFAGLLLGLIGLAWNTRIDRE